MNLVFSDTRDTGKYGDSYTVNPMMMLTPAVHLFISSHRWDSITLPLTDNLRPEHISQLHTRTDNIMVSYEECTPNILAVLCALYPSSAGKIRKAYMEGATELPGVNYAKL